MHQLLAILNEERHVNILMKHILDSQKMLYITFFNFFAFIGLKKTRNKRRDVTQFF